MNLVFSILLVYSSFAVLDAQVENVTQATPMAVTTIATTTTTLKPRKGVFVKYRYGNIRTLNRKLFEKYQIFLKSIMDSVPEFLSKKGLLFNL